MPGPKIDHRIPDLVSLAEAADMLGISRQAAYKRLMSGDLPGKMIGKTWVFRRAAVEPRRNATTRHEQDA